MLELACLKSIIARVNTLSAIMDAIVKERWKQEQSLGTTILELRQDIVQQWVLIDNLSISGVDESYELIPSPPGQPDLDHL